MQARFPGAVPDLQPLSVLGAICATFIQKGLELSGTSTPTACARFSFFSLSFLSVSDPAASAADIQQAIERVDQPSVAGTLEVRVQPLPPALLLAGWSP